MTQMKVNKEMDDDQMKNIDKDAGLADTVANQQAVSFGESVETQPEDCDAQGPVVLMTGATGGIGSHLKTHLQAEGLAGLIVPVSRKAQTGSLIAPCDLIKNAPNLADITASPGSDKKVKVDWIIHLATSYKEEDDLKMVEHLLKCARDNNIQNFMYVSSWVTHFPKAIMEAEYIKMKRACEKKILEEAPECIKRISIVRPSVVTGRDLSWSQALSKLSLISPVIPRVYSRSFVTVQQLNDVIVEEMGDHNELSSDTEKRQVTTVTSLGDRAALKDKAAEHARSESPLIAWQLLQKLMPLVIVALLLFPQSLTGFTSQTMVWLFASIFALGWFLNRPLAGLLSKVSDYLAGFVRTDFEPETEADVLALIHHRNKNVHIRGYNNAHLYFHCRNSPRHTTVSLRKYNKVLNIDTDRMVIRVQSGAHFGQLLPLLEEKGLWMDNYPNYHFITVGSCILTAVHGSSLSYPFIADLVTWVKYYDRDSGEVIVMDREHPQFNSVVFNTGRLGQIVILEADMKICKREYYKLSTQKKSVDELNFDNIDAFIDQAQHYEIRINTPYDANASLQSYEQVAEHGKGILDIKADKIGNKWNILQKNSLNSWLTSKMALTTLNYEWFFKPEDFARFWEEISSDRTKYRMYKLLVRYNREREDVNTPYHGTISIDVTIRNSHAMIECSKQLFKKYKPMEHHGKYSIEKNHL